MLAFITANAAPIAIVAAILAIVFARPLLRWLAPVGWEDRDGFHRGHGPTHDHPSRDSDRQRGVSSNHNEGITQ